MLHPADTVSSHVHQAKGFHRWTSVQDSAYGTVSPSAPSKVRSLSYTVGEWTSQLCIRLPQVRALSIVIPSKFRKSAIILLTSHIADSSSSPLTET